MDTPFVTDVLLSSQINCAEDGGQYDAGHECVVTGRDVLTFAPLFWLPQNHHLNRIINRQVLSETSSLLDSS